MGQTLMGGTSQQRNIDLLTPEQRSFLSSILGGLGPQAGAAYSQFLQPQSQEDLQSAFQKGVVDPSLQQYQQQVLPAIQQRFVDAGAGSSSALNQALSSSAQDLQTSLAGQYLPFMQGQQQLQLGALGQLGGLAGQRTFEPVVGQQQGILGPLIQALSQLGAGYFMSSEEVKENIRPYEKGLDAIKDLEVKMYDYIEQLGGQKNRVGLIAEKVPEEFQGSMNGVKAVDVYGLVGLLINGMKELSDKIEQLEAKRGTRTSRP